jgi:hypothetical protein
VSTLQHETPREDLVEAVARLKKPAGLQMEYSVIAGMDYNSLKTKISTYNALKAAYATYNALKSAGP